MPAFSWLPGPGATATRRLPSTARSSPDQRRQTTLMCLPRFVPLSLDPDVMRRITNIGSQTANHLHTYYSQPALDRMNISDDRHL